MPSHHRPPGKSNRATTDPKIPTGRRRRLALGRRLPAADGRAKFRFATCLKNFQKIAENEKHVNAGPFEGKSFCVA